MSEKTTKAKKGRKGKTPAEYNRDKKQLYIDQNLKQVFKDEIIPDMIEVEGIDLNLQGALELLVRKAQMYYAVEKSIKKKDKDMIFLLFSVMEKAEELKGLLFQVLREIEADQAEEAPVVQEAV